MAVPQTLPDLTKPELAIMKLFWAAGPLSAREVHERRQSTTDWAYSTTRTTLDRMVKKRVLTKKISTASVFTSHGSRSPSGSPSSCETLRIGFSKWNQAPWCRCSREMSPSPRKK